MSTVTSEKKPEAKLSYKVVMVPLNKISDVSINVRFKNNLDIATMKDEIALAGRVKDPILLWLPSEDAATTLGVAKGQYVVVRGNRRTIATKELLNEPDLWTASLLDTIKTIPAFINDNLTLAEAEELVLDHNSMKRIAKSEIVNSIFRRWKGNRSEMDIILEMHRIIGEDLVGKADKVRQLEEINDPKKRRDFARKWLHTYVGNYLIRACKLGPFVGQQVLFHYKQGDGLLQDGETVHFVANTSAIQTLSAAKTEDDKDGSWLSGIVDITISSKGIEVEGGGNATKQAVIDLITAHKSGKKKATQDGPKVLSQKDLEDRKDSFQSPTVIGALRMALGHEVPDLADLDMKSARAIKVYAILVEHLSQVKDPKVKTLLSQIVDENVNPMKVAESCKALC